LAVKGLISAFDAEPDASVRAWIVHGLSALDVVRGLPVFEKALSDPDAQVRGAGVLALGTLGGPRASSDLVAALNSETNPGVRQAIAFWLGTFKDDAAAAALDKALSSDSDPNVRIQSARSLKWVGTKAAKRKLKKAEQDPDERVRRIAHE
jgi:HEAT repeat protein